MGFWRSRLSRKLLHKLRHLNGATPATHNQVKALIDIDGSLELKIDKQGRAFRWIKTFRVATSHSPFFLFLRNQRLNKETFPPKTKLWTLHIALPTVKKQNTYSLYFYVQEKNYGAKFEFENVTGRLLNKRSVSDMKTVTPPPQYVSLLRSKKRNEVGAND